MLHRRDWEHNGTIAHTPEQRDAAFAEHRKLLEDFRAVAQAAYQAGQRPITDVLAVKYQLDELRLKRIEVGRK